jgi:pyrroline-5-carboxylate reductase
MTTIGFIGAGNMGGAIIKGVSAKLRDVSISFYEPDETKVQVLESQGFTKCKCEAEVLNRAKYVFIAVKPQSLPDVLPKISRTVTDETVLISICAGISGEYITKYLNRQAKIVLAMPNTPLMLGVGATAVSKCEGVTDEEFAIVRSFFDSCGITAEIPSDKMKEIICINGSGPAFVYLFAKPFYDYAVANGIQAEAAMSLLSQTLIGAAKMITDSGKTIDELIKMVSSPGGTTIAGLSGLYDGHFVEAITEACNRCTARAYELGGD